MNIQISTKPFRDYVIGDYMITNVNRRTNKAVRVNSVISNEEVDITPFKDQLSKIHRNSLVYVRGDFR